MPSGRMRTPREVKRRRGTLRKDRDPQPLTVIAPATIANVDEGPGRDFIQEALDSGAAIWLGHTDGPALETLRQLWSDREKARADWLKMPYDKDVFSAYNELTKRLLTCLTQLGFDPTGRAKLGVAEVRRQSTLDAIQERRARRKAAGRPAG